MSKKRGPKPMSAAERRRKRAESDARWKARNPDYHREYLLRTKYGMTLQEWDCMAKAQDHCCAICQVQPSRLVVDHCHTTGTVRGLLCSQCNQGLGMFRDNVDALHRAQLYLSNTTD